MLTSSVNGLTGIGETGYSVAKAALHPYAHNLCSFYGVRRFSPLFLLCADPTATAASVGCAVSLCVTCAQFPPPLQRLLHRRNSRLSACLMVVMMTTMMIAIGIILIMPVIAALNRTYIF